MKIVRPSLILAGTIIGAGMFGLPYAFLKAGFFTGVFYLAILATVIFVLHLAYADVAIQTSGNHRMMGYAAAWLGKKGVLAATIVNVIALLGGLLVYLTLGSHFLGALFKDGGQYTFISAAIFSLAIIVGKKLFEWLEWALAILMALLMAAVFAFGVGTFHGAAPRLFSFTPGFIIYGIALFSLYGASAIPELKEYFTSRAFTIRSIALGTYIPTLLYILFVIGIWGLSYGNISEDALSGIERYPAFARIGYALGFLAMATSYWTISLNLKHLLQYDFRAPGLVSALVVLVTPLAVLLISNPDFVGLMGLVGSVAIGLEAIIIVVIHNAMQKKTKGVLVRLPVLASGIFVALFILGILQHFL